MKNINNEVLNIVNGYDYTKEVIEYVEKLKNELTNMHSNQVIALNCNIIVNYIDTNEDDIINKVSKQIINYRIREKAFVKLMSEGLIYPIRICDGWYKNSERYEIRNGNNKSCTTGTFSMRRIVFNEFMKF